MSSSVPDTDAYINLYRGNIIPLNACLPGLTWVLHDYLVTLEDEIRYIWPQPWNTGKCLFIWIRYYGIALLIFDVTQIHLFSRPGITNDNVCVAMDSVIRIAGAILLWSIEIIMQLRIFAIYNCSKKVGIVNFALFLASIGGFAYILIFNALRRHSVIKDALHFDLPGCPSIHTGIEWVQWVPATGFEGVLFAWALYKTVSSSVTDWKRISVYELVLRDNIMYFFGITCLLIFNNLMVVGVTHIPWFSYAPFHAAMQIMTSRMLINLYKTVHAQKEDFQPSTTLTVFSTNFTTSTDPLSIISHNNESDSSHV